MKKCENENTVSKKYNTTFYQTNQGASFAYHQTDKNIYSPKRGDIKPLDPDKKRNFCISKVPFLVEHNGLEPMTPTLPVLCAPNCANAPNDFLLIYYTV